MLDKSMVLFIKKDEKTEKRTKPGNLTVPGLNSKPKKGLEPSTPSLRAIRLKG